MENPVGGVNQVRWRNCVNCLMALWIIIAPWMLRILHYGNVLASCVIGGMVLLAVSVWGAVADHWNVWGIIISAVCGIFFVVQPFLGHYTNGAYFAIVIPGIVTLFLDLWTGLTDPTLGLRNGPRAQI